MKSFRPIQTILCACLFMPSVSAENAQEEFDRSWRFPAIAIPRLGTPPLIDGAVTDDVWQRATLFPALLSRDPLAGDGAPPRERTWIWMGYTADAVYWAFRQDLPPEEMPVKATVVDRRDGAEGRDNTVNIQFSTSPKSKWEQFNISGNAASQIYDRRFDDGSGKYWNPNIEYRSQKKESGWEGEMKIPFSELGLATAPGEGTEWNCYFYSAWRKSGTRLFAWPYVGWRQKGETSRLIFGGDTPGVRFETDGKVTLRGPNSDKATSALQLLYKPKSEESSLYFPSVASSVQASTGEGATFQSFDEIIRGALAGYRQVPAVHDVGEYLLRYDVHLNGKTLARGVQSYYVAPQLDIDVTPYFLMANKLKVKVETQINGATSVRLTIQPGAATEEVALRQRRCEAIFDTAQMSVGTYRLSVEAVGKGGDVLSRHEETFEKPAPPNWWVMDEGRTPLVPPPWTPIEATADQTTVLGRVYSFKDLALPSSIQTRGRSILASPIRLETDAAWDASDLKLTTHSDDEAIYVTDMKRDAVELKVHTRLEFDGFMTVDLALSGTGIFKKLDLVIPLKEEHAKLLQNYTMAPGPGKATGRFHGEIPNDGYTSPPFITTWIGTDHYGLEFSCESSRGWSMAKPNEAISVTREPGKVVLRIKFISRPIHLTDHPRRIRFGLIATPTKTILPHVGKARFYDDVHVALLPYDWAGFPAWHPPVTDHELIEKGRKWVASVHDRHQKLLVNGGWAVSVQDTANAPWIKEMFSEPLKNVSYSSAKQYAYCYRTPYATFLANSFGHNARALGFDGIRFDTVTPGYTCDSLIHDCGWFGDDGNRWPTFGIFSQRETWKRIYRAFHGGSIPEGIVYTPNAAGPIMAVHSFSDHHEIGEGFYQKAKDLKTGYPPDMVRSIMTGEPYGFITAANLKMGPLFANERIAALIVNGAEPRFHDSRHWRPGYAAHSSPAASVWDAWEWVDRYSAQWLGWWENHEYATVDTNQNTIYASLYLQKGKRVLLIVSNYEKAPVDDLQLSLNMKSLGFTGAVFGEDAITGQPIPISQEGRLKLDVFGQRYRLVKVSSEPPAYREDKLIPIKIEFPDELTKSWTSSDIAVTSDSTYVLQAEVKIDKPIGNDSNNPNYMGKFSPAVRHYVSMTLSGAGITGINGSNRRSGIEPYDQTPEYRRTFAPQWWEQTPGWMTMFVPVRTGPQTVSGKVVVSITDPGQASVRKLTLRKLTD